MTEMSWQRRLAIVLSAIWLLLVGAISSDEDNGFMVFLMLGALPVGFCWGIGWVWSGFQKQRTPKSTAVTSEAPTQSESIASATLFRTLAVVLLAGGLAVFYYAFSKTSVEPAGKIGYLVGFYFWVPLLVYFLWKGTFKRKKGVGALLFSIAFLGIAIYQAHGMIKEEEDAKRLLSTAQNMMLKLMNGELVERTALSNIGQYSAVLLVTHDFLSEVFSDFEALNTKIEKSGLETMLSPQTLQDPRQINASLTTLHELTALIDRTDKQLTARYDAFPRQIDSADIPYNVKADFRTGAEGGIKRGKDSLADFFTIQRTFIATAIDMLEFMKARQGRFRQQGERLMFDSQSDLDTYNQYLQLIQALALQESEWRNRQLSTSAKQIQEMPTR